MADPAEVDLVVMMSDVGRQECDRGRLCDGPGPALVAAIEQFGPAGRADPPRLVSSLAVACLPVGGWAVFGAERVVSAVLGPCPALPDWHRLADAAIEVLQAHYVRWVRVPDTLWERYLARGGSIREWLPFQPPPEPHEAAITPLFDGETRCLITASDSPEASRVLVHRCGIEVIAVIDANWGVVGPDGSAVRSVFEWKRAAEIYDLYLDIGWTTADWHWAHPEIEPFFPAPRTLI